MLNSARSQAFGRYVIGLDTASANYVIKLQQRQGHEDVVRGFENELAYYAFAPKAQVLEHDIVASTDLIQVMSQHSAFAFICQQWQADHFLSQALVLTQAQPVFNLPIDQSSVYQSFQERVGNCLQALAKLPNITVHGDIKPEHFVMHAGQCYLIDYDQATLTGVISEGYPAKTLQGTPRYMSPELFHGKAKSFGSDLYAFGICLLEYVLNQRLKAGNYLEWAYLHCQQDLIGLLEDQAIAEFMSGLITKYPEQRYKNQQELHFAYQKMNEKLN